MRKNVGIRKGRMKKIGQKGIGPIAIAIVLMVGVIVFEGVYVNNFIANTEVMKRTARELGVIKAVNIVEFAKKSLQQAVSYSFYKSSIDVLDRGGFCASDENPCTETCKIPKEVPTHECRPWWRVYTGTHAPEYGGYDEDLNPEPFTFLSYLVNRTSLIYNDYGRNFLAPEYCPQPPGKVIVKGDGVYRTHVNITNTEDGIIEYKSDEGEVDIVEHTVNFIDSFATSTSELFKFAREKFVDADQIESDFIAADKEMPNDWCEKVGEYYCNLTVDCRAPPHSDICFDDSRPYTNCCWGENCCCKGMHFGDICESDFDYEICENSLPIYCSREEEFAEINPCDFNDDSTIDADEKYNCTVQEIFNTGVTNDDDTFLATSSVAGCIKVDHSSDVGYTPVSVDWKEYRDALQEGGEKLREVEEKCYRINRQGCGCEEYCDEIVLGADCGPCAGFETGSFDGQCPTGDGWENGELTCSEECCAEKVICTESKEEWCSGSNTEACTPEDCNEDCCAPLFSSGFDALSVPLGKVLKMQAYCADWDESCAVLSCCAGYTCCGQCNRCYNVCPNCLCCNDNSDCSGCGAGECCGSDDRCEPCSLPSCPYTCMWPPECDSEGGTCLTGYDCPADCCCEPPSPPPPTCPYTCMWPPECDSEGGTCLTGYDCPADCCCEPPTPPPECTEDSDCCEPGLEGIRVICMGGVCDLAAPGEGYLCPSACTDDTNPIPCDELNPKGADCPCGCDYNIEFTHTISFQCRAAACGDTCCLQTNTLYEDVTCTYEYFGTANVSVDVRDVKNVYPIDSEWTELKMPFYVVSGNVDECIGTTPIEASEYVEEESICCPALTTHDRDEAEGCKTGTTTIPLPDCPYSCITNAECLASDGTCVGGYVCVDFPCCCEI